MNGLRHDFLVIGFDYKKFLRGISTDLVFDFLASL